MQVDPVEGDFDVDARAVQFSLHSSGPDIVVDELAQLRGGSP
ncbi:MAG TPA: hypothetical protein VGD71_22545 [Kribbella sp.]